MKSLRQEVLFASRRVRIPYVLRDIHAVRLRLSAHCICVLFAIALSGCAAPTSNKPAARSAAASVIVEGLPEWQKAVSLADHEKLKGSASAWGEALSEADKTGFKRARAAEGKLLEPTSGQPFPAPSPGNYMCRLIQIGRASGRQRSFATSKADFCYVGVDDGGRLGIDKQTGSQQHTSSLFHDELPRRLIFLGARKGAGRQRGSQYGEASDRDVAGVFEHIGALRYRLTLPRPTGRFKLEVLEFTPAPIQLES
jgi:hypothetical protein